MIYPTMIYYVTTIFVLLGVQQNGGGVVYGQPAPAVAPAPVQAPNFGFLPCSVCQVDGQIMTDPSAVVVNGTFTFITSNISCISLELRAQTAQFDLTQCGELGTVSDICGCEFPSTDTPAIAPTTTSPVVAGTPIAPIPVPVPVPVSVPVPIVIMTGAPAVPVLIPVVGALTIQLFSVSSTMTEDDIAVYEEQLTTFYTILLIETSDVPFTNLTASVVSQSLMTPPPATAPTSPSNDTTTNSTRRFYLRALQDTNSTTGVYVLDTVVNVAGLLQDDAAELVSNQTEFNEGLVSLTNENESQLIQGLVGSGSSYFATITNATSVPPPPPAAPSAPVAAPSAPVAAPSAPVAAPTSSDDDGLSTGAIVGIAIGGVAGAALLLGVLFFASKPAEEPQALAKSTTASSSVKPPGGSIKQSVKIVTFVYKNHRVVTAPPGRLGIVINKTSDGPIVKRVADDSPLVTLLSVGDKILQIDDKDATNMSTTDITTYMSENTDKERLLKVCTPVSITRTVVAPPGPLGITIDKGAMIKSVKDDSVLNDQVYAKEFILKVDDKDVTDMTPAALSQYLKDNADNERVLTIAPAAKEPKYETLTVIAPAGKLGIVIERSNTGGGPVIKRINETSALYGKMMVNDQIIMIDEEDAAEMTSSAVADYLSKHTDAEERKFIIKRLVPDDDDDVLTVAVAVAPPSYEEINVVAPPGKLGIVIERTPKGPIIKTVHDQSPLKDQLIVGDNIVRIDDQDVKGMTSSQIADYLVKNASNERTIVVSRLVVVDPSKPVEEIQITTPQEEEKEEVQEEDVPVAAASTDDLLVDTQEPPPQEEIEVTAEAASVTETATTTASTLEK